MDFRGGFTEQTFKFSFERQVGVPEVAELANFSTGTPLGEVPVTVLCQGKGRMS